MLPFKNEEKFLPTYLSNVQPVCDEIIAIDDNSTDNSRQIMEDAGVIVKGYEDTENLKGGWTCGLIRQHLFNYGREAGGTHFVCLDADENLYFQLCPNRQRYYLSVATKRKSTTTVVSIVEKVILHIVDDHTVWSRNFKDFIVCDDSSLTYEYQYMCEGRTIGWHDDNTLRRLEVEHGGVLHYQFACFNNFLLKQAWCQVGELVQQGPGALGAINNKYSICYQDQNVGMRDMPAEWTEGIPQPPVPNFDPEWKEENFLRKNLLPDIYRHFDEYGVEYFRGLNIWQIPQLNERLNG